MSPPGLAAGPERDERLTYQLPALLLDRPTLVISPLLAYLEPAG